MEEIPVHMYLNIAAEVLGVDDATIVRIANIPLIESALAAPFASFDGVEFYEEPRQKAAIICSRLVRNHPLTDGNKRSAYLSMLMFLLLNAIPWHPPTELERSLTIEGLAARTVTEEEFVVWVRTYTS